MNIADELRKIADLWVKAPDLKKSDLDAAIAGLSPKGQTVYRSNSFPRMLRLAAEMVDSQEV